MGSGVEIKTLGEICEVISGGTPSRARKEFWENGDIPWIKIGNLKGKYVNESDECITKLGLENSATKLLPRGTILYSIFATLGETGILSIEACTNQAIAGIIINDKMQVSTEYLYYFLKSKKKKVNNIGRGVAQNNINISMLKGFKILLPEYVIQCKMVDIFDKIENIIEMRKAELESLDKLVRARFVEMFGDPVKNTKGWQVKRLEELSIQINSGNTPKGGSSVYVDEGIAFFRSQNVWKDRLEMEDIVYISNDTHVSMKRSSLKNGDILMTKTGRINTENSSLGRAALYVGEDDKANVNGHVYFIRLKPEVNNKFILRILVSVEYRDLIRSVCVGGIDKRQLNKEHIENFPIICPPDNLVDKYIELVGHIDKSKLLSVSQPQIHIYKTLTLL